METPADGDSRPFPRLARFYSLLVPPMQPSAEDAALCWEAAGEWIRERGAPRVLLLGVTPALYHLPWPEGTDLLAVDISQPMIDAMWPGPKDTVLCTDWLSMDLPAGARDLAVWDGSLTFLDYPRGQSELVRILHRTLSEGGLCVFRTFVLPPERETPEVVIRDLRGGKIANLSTLLLRLFTSMQQSPEQGIVFGRVYDTIAAVPHLSELVAELGWATEYLGLIDQCRAIQARCHLPTLDQTLDLFRTDPGGFRIQRVHTPSYDLGELCPTIAVERC